MGGDHFQTAHRRTKPANSRMPAATAPSCDLPAQRSAYARSLLLSGHEPPPEMPRIRRRPQTPGHGREKRIDIPPPEPLLLHGADATRLAEAEHLGAPSAAASAGQEHSGRGPGPSCDGPSVPGWQGFMNYKTY
jgi:hypothetical protein